MKKENRKMAQERRAKERRKKELQRRISKIIVIAVPVVAVIFLGAAIIITSAPSSDSSTSEDTDSASDSTSGYSDDVSLTVEDGDTVNIDYVGYVDGTEFEGGNTEGSGTDLVIGSGTYIDDFEEQLIGHHPGDTVDVNVTFPDPYQSNTDLSGKDALFKVTINGIYE